jgi:hypothetical protein
VLNFFLPFHVRQTGTVSRLPEGRASSEDQTRSNNESVTEPLLVNLSASRQSAFSAVDASVAFDAETRRTYHDEPKLGLSLLCIPDDDRECRDFAKVRKLLAHSSPPALHILIQQA